MTDAIAIATACGDSGRPVTEGSSLSPAGSGGHSGATPRAARPDESQSRAKADAAATRLGVLSRASRIFVDSNLELTSRLNAVVSELAQALDGCVNIALLEPNGLVHLTAVHHPEPLAQEQLLQVLASAPLELGEGVMGSIAATGQSVLLPMISPEQLAGRAPQAYRAFLEAYPVHAMMGAALRVQGRVIGAVTATRCREGETYTTEDLHLLEELAERAAIPIENGRLYQETLLARTRAEQLNRFAQAVISADRVETVFEAALASIATALGAKRVAILTYGDDELMRFRAWRDLSDAYRSAVDGHSPWRRDETAPEPVLVQDALRDPAMAAYLPLFRSEGIGALAFIPLVSAGRLLGRFMVYYDRPHSFSANELEMARALANHLAWVITRFAVIAKLEDTIRYNELFAGVLAHDLRNPLGAMINSAQLLLMPREGERVLGDAEMKPLGSILRSGQRMATMIERLLDFTRARSGGGIAVEPHETNLADLCAQAVGEIELGQPDWVVHCHVIGDQHGFWDSDLLLQVLSNLVSNAGQHGVPQTPVLVRLDGTHRESVQIEVHNRGEIPPALLPHLFDPFRSTRHRRDQSRGLGLGLFIVREIVRGHAGTIEVSSSEGDGTCFLLRLPRRAGAQERDLADRGRVIDL